MKCVGMPDASFGKLCTGPAHEEPVRLPVTEEYWYFHKTGKDAGKPIPRCRLCTNFNKLKNPNGDHGWVPAEKVYPLVQELVARCGGSMATAAEFASLGEDTIGRVIRHERPRVQKRTVRKVVLALYEKRKEDRRNGSNESFRKSKKAQADREDRLMRLSGY